MVRFRIYFKVLAHRDLLLIIQVFIAVLAGENKEATHERWEWPWYYQLYLTWSFLTFKAR